MAKYIKTYCAECKRETTHCIEVEDGAGATGFARIFTTILTAGTCNLYCEKWCTCCSCGHSERL